MVLNAIYPKHHKICSLCAQFFYSSRSIRYLSNKKHIVRPVRIFNHQYRYSSQSQDEFGEDTQNSDRSSTTHQEFHRRAYERKRSSYQENKQNRSTAIKTTPFTQGITHYQRLNVDPEAKLSDIKTAYYSLSKLYHPDVRGPEDSEAGENFRLITESYDVLSDANQRSDYDKQLNLNDADRPTEVAWRPSNNHRNRDNPVFRMRDADLIFRLKQEAAFLEEKRKNPEKFRAGSFIKDHESINLDTELQKLNKLMDNLSGFRSGSANPKDGNDFYRSHLRDTIYRKRSDIHEAKRSIYHRNAAHTNNEGVVILTILGVAVVLVTYSLGVLYKVDYAAKLDAALERKVKEIREGRTNV